MVSMYKTTASIENTDEHCASHNFYGNSQNIPWKFYKLAWNFYLISTHLFSTNFYRNDNLKRSRKAAKTNTEKVIVNPNPLVLSLFLKGESEFNYLFMTFIWWCFCCCMSFGSINVWLNWSISPKMFTEFWLNYSERVFFVSSV